MLKNYQIGVPTTLQINVYGRSVHQKTGRQKTAMAKAGTLPFFCYKNTHSDAHIAWAQAVNESDIEEPMEEEAINKMVNMQKQKMKLPTGRRLEMKILLTKNFLRKLLLNNKMIPDTLHEKQYLVALIIKNLMWKLVIPIYSYKEV